MPSQEAVTPANAGASVLPASGVRRTDFWIPAFAGMTLMVVSRLFCEFAKIGL